MHLPYKVETQDEQISNMIDTSIKGLIISGQSTPMEKVDTALY